jgi:hypothetical protein
VEEHLFGAIVRSNKTEAFWSDDFLDSAGHSDSP